MNVNTGMTVAWLVADLRAEGFSAEANLIEGMAAVCRKEPCESSASLSIAADEPVECPESETFAARYRYALALIDSAAADPDGMSGVAYSAQVPLDLIEGKTEAEIAALLCENAHPDRPASARPSAGVGDLTLRALDLAQSICDVVPSRLQEVAEEGSWQQRLASLVNVRPDGFHGYAVIRDALDAFKSAPVAPAAEGWVLVPREPTFAMRAAHDMYGDTSDWWNAVITAAPSPAQPEAT